MPQKDDLFLSGLYPILIDLGTILHGMTGGKRRSSRVLRFLALDIPGLTKIYIIGKYADYILEPRPWQFLVPGMSPFLYLLGLGWLIVSICCCLTRASTPFIHPLTLSVTCTAHNHFTKKVSQESKWMMPSVLLLGCF